MAYAGFRARSGDYGVIPGAARLSLPRGLDPTGLEWVHFMTHGAAVALRNWAPGKDDAIVTGSPIEHDGYLELRSSFNYLTMHLTDTGQAMTRIIGARDIGSQVDIANRFFWGGSGFVGSPLVQGVCLFSSGPDALQVSARYSDGVAPASRTLTLAVPGGPASPMRLAIASTGGPGSTASTNDDLQVSEYIAGVSGSGAQGDGYARMGTGAKFGCGHAVGVNLTGSGHVWCDIAFSRILSVAEKLILRNWLINTGRAHGLYA
ncbi:hypothetical protein KRZ98_06170 [Sphingobium sp. AS12]|uniref:hypothetical protein n=1 Tax=Sphingobium sp. AS12 TaxID=2849495 RepID=UPI001C31C693|nr:hypothetical protein [Sphingobium sp. AS12]MBV2147875.1 hypothetical protein [Sphingobium sp. AS12]